MAAEIVRAVRHGAVGSGYDLAWGVLEDLEPLRLLHDAWDELLRPGQFFVAPAWVLHWLAWQQDRVTPHVLVAQDHCGRLRGLLPLARTRDGRLIPCGAEHGAVGLDVVARTHEAAAVAAGAVAFLDRLPWRRLRLAHVLAGGALHGALRRAAPGRIHERVSTYCPYVVTARPWEEYLQGQSKHRRHELRRKLKRALEVPGTSVRWIERPADVRSAMETLFTLHARRFASLRRTTRFRGAELQAFHVGYARELAVRGGLILGILERDGRPLAGVYGFRCRGGSGLFQSGFDPDAGFPGAGEALRILLLQAQAERADLRELDLLDGCYPWKLRLASGIRRQFHVDVYPHGARGFLAWFVRWVGRGLKRRVLALIRRKPRCPGLCGEDVNAEHCRRAGCPDAAAEHARAA
ncbi:MAG: GNAT family N-acetyltransferase [Planctomycetota bacterium]|nr:GNAT family N-acetyltransferase [Planctomycetota bacterium]